MNRIALWDHALDHLRATAENPEQMLEQWRSETPARFTDRDLLGEYGWVVVSCGLTPHVATKHWPRLTEAFWNWEPGPVTAHSRDVRVAALGVLKNPRKIDAILAYADDLAREPGQMQRLAALPLKEALARLSMLPFVGATNRYHLARNLGWDVVVKTGSVPRLAAYLETTAEALCEAIATETGERIRTVDLVLWYWGHQVGDAAMKEMASLFKLL
ncbi:MAG TPA: hypothetical protein VD902_16325 [Symbiobacteriaceae bacterium]|nr:hypothetical protein [Symbiobacteriaceae bacterium]